jgi:hypothetical protein
MSTNFGTLIGSAALKSGLFGKKPAALEIYTEGIVLKYKNEDLALPFAEISAIKSLNYFTPTPISYDFQIFNLDNAKVLDVSVPYTQLSGATALLEAHMSFRLTEAFPQNLMHTDFILDDFVTWKNGKLYYKWKKGVKEFTPSQIDKFIEHKGTHAFTMKNSDETVGVSLTFAPNCLMTLAICRAIADLS